MDAFAARTSLAPQHLKDLRGSDTYDANACMGGVLWRLARALLTVNVRTQALPHVQAG